MAVLKSLTFTTLPTGGNPILDRRTKIIARLEEQKLILKDPNYTRTVRIRPAPQAGAMVCREALRQRRRPWTVV